MRILLICLISLVVRAESNQFPINSYQGSNAGLAAWAAGSKIVNYFLTHNVEHEKTKPYEIHGMCIVQSPKAENLKYPCHNTVFYLKDSDNKEVAGTMAENGKFWFTVQKGSKYKLLVESKKYKIAENWVDALSGGDQVAIRLLPKKP